MAANAHESARPCGCDPGAKWICERHRGFIGVDELAEVTPAQYGYLIDRIVAKSYGDCIGCDGYILALSEAPYCPTCARLRREAAATEQDGIV